MVHFKPTTNRATATTVADLFIEAVFRPHGIPSETISDRGTQFTAAFWQAFTQRLGIRFKMSTAYHPQTDGQTERTNRVVADTLRHYTMEYQSTWDEYLPIVEFAINNAVNVATGMTPFFVLYGRHPNLPWNLPQKTENPAGMEAAQVLKSRLERAKRCMQAAQERMRVQYNQKHEPKTYQIGDKVLLSTKNMDIPVPTKILPRFIGPFKILEVINTQAYRLELPSRLKKLHDVFHVSLLRPYRSDGTYQPPPIGWATDGDAIWEVEKIMKHREHISDSRKSRQKPVYQYLIRWSGFTSEHNTWEPEEQILDKKLITEYWAKVEQKQN
jgi:hypothetical protein